MPYCLTACLPSLCVSLSKHSPLFFFFFLVLMRSINAPSKFYPRSKAVKHPPPCNEAWLYWSYARGNISTIGDINFLLMPTGEKLTPCYLQSKAPLIYCTSHALTYNTCLPACLTACLPCLHACIAMHLLLRISLFERRN